MPSSSSGRRRTLLILGGGLLGALLLFLLMADFFSGWSGLAGSWRPLPGGGTDADPVWRVTLVEDGGGYTEVVLPVDALSGSNVPQNNAGVPPRRLPDTAPLVEKSHFSLTLRVDGRPSSTVENSDVAAPVLLWVLLLLGILASGRLSKPGKPVGLAAGQAQAPVPPKRKASGKGPPPRHRSKRRRR